MVLWDATWTKLEKSIGEKQKYINIKSTWKYFKLFLNTLNPNPHTQCFKTTANNKNAFKN